MNFNKTCHKFNIQQILEYLNRKIELINKFIEFYNF